MTSEAAKLHAAANVGLRLPETLISQDPAEIRKFYDHFGGGVIVKTVAGTKLTPLLTGKLTPALLEDEVSLALAPAIYQQLIEGDRHLRICVFGEKIFAARLISSRLDWRYPLDVESEIVDLDETIASALDLRMGIFDLKETHGEPVFLEVDPQGQFLLLEGHCGLPLTDAFAEFLLSELADVRAQRAAPC